MEEDKATVLNRIFGNDLTQSTITNTLRENNDEFDQTVEKLLTLPSNKPRAPEPAPLDAPAQENIHRLHNMFADLSASVVATVFEANKRDVEGTVDTLLQITSKDDNTEERRKAEIARQEQELKTYEEFKKLQLRLKEEEDARRKAAEAQRKALEEAQRRAAEEAQRAAAQKVYEDEQRRAAEQQRVRDQQAAMIEQEKALQAFQQRRREEELKKAEEGKKVELKKTEELRKAEEAKKKEALELERKLQEQLEHAKKVVEAEKKRIEDEKARVEVEKKKVAEQEQALIAERKKQAAAEEAKRLQQASEEAKARAEAKRQEERKLEEDKIMKKRFEEEKAMLQEQRSRAEAERKILEERVRLERLREEEERKKRYEDEKRFREEQERARKAWDDKMKELENERAQEEKKRKEIQKAEEDLKRAEEERVRQEADMRRILELERLKLDEQRKKVEEEKLKAEDLRRAMEQASMRREQEEERKRLEEEQRAEEERRRLEEERLRIEQERTEAELKRKIAEESFAASAVMVAPVPKVTIEATVEGSEIRGQWTLTEGALPSTQAWVGVFPRRSNNTYSGFLYVSGVSGEFHFKGLTPGHYEVRFFTNKPVASRIAESAPLLVGPKVSHFTMQQQGDQLVLEYSLEAPASPSTWDWVGIFEKNQRRNKDYISSTYGNPSGIISAPLPRTPGEYQARLFAAGSKYNEQSLVDFVVVDNDCINAPATAAPETPIKASWVLRTVEPSSSDWVGLFPAGEASNNKYLASVYTTGSSFGEVNVPVPKDIAPGVYELRLFSSKVGKYITHKTSGPIHIALP